MRQSKNSTLTTLMDKVSQQPYMVTLLLTRQCIGRRLFVIESKSNNTSVISSVTYEGGSFLFL